MSGSPYGDAFYESQRGSSYRSAKAIAPIVLDLVRARSVVDVGCGVGAWLKAFAESGVERILGIDGPWAGAQSLLIPPERFVARDLCRPLEIEETFDLVVSVEVAEHLPPEHAEGFVRSLVGLGPAVLFSAAIPFQTGVSHVNVQWPSYWAARFAEHGYVAVDCIRPALWRNEDVVYWYAQNLLLFVAESRIDGDPALAAARTAHAGMPLDIVHPTMFLARADPSEMNWRKALADLPKVLLSAFRRWRRRRASRTGRDAEGETSRGNTP